MCQQIRVLLPLMYVHPEEHRKGRQEQSKLGRRPTLTMTQDRYTQLRGFRCSHTITENNCMLILVTWDSWYYCLKEFQPYHQGFRRISQVSRHKFPEIFWFWFAQFLDIPIWGPDKVSNTQQKRDLSEKKVTVAIYTVTIRDYLGYLFLQLPQHKIMLRRTDGKV